MVMSLDRSKVNFIHFRKDGIHIQPFEIERNYFDFWFDWSFLLKWTFHINNWHQKVKSRSTKVKWTLCSTSKNMKISTKTISFAISCVCLPWERIFIFYFIFVKISKFRRIFQWLKVSLEFPEIGFRLTWWSFDLGRLSSRPSWPFQNFWIFKFWKLLVP